MKKTTEQLMHFPAALAMSDYMGGLTLSDNPYPKKSFQYKQYEKAMHGFLSAELKSIYQEMKSCQ